MRTLIRRFPWLFLPLMVLIVIAAGGVVFLMRGLDGAETLWSLGLLVTGAPVLWRTIRDARHGQFATDIVAVLAILGAVALRQPLAGLVIVLMQSGGEGLEQYAEGKASAAVRALEEAAPR